MPHYTQQLSGLEIMRILIKPPTSPLTTRITSSYISNMLRPLLSALLHKLSTTTANAWEYSTSRTRISQRSQFKRYSVSTSIISGRGGLSSSIAFTINKDITRTPSKPSIFGYYFSNRTVALIRSRPNYSVLRIPFQLGPPCILPSLVFHPSCQIAVGLHDAKYDADHHLYKLARIK